MRPSCLDARLSCMEIVLKYGKGQMSAQIPPENLAGFVRAKEVPVVPDELEAVKQALASPIGSPPLREIIRRKKAKNAVVVVNDITRPTPYHVYLPALEEELQEVDEVTFIVATGLHRGHTDEENLAIFGDYPRRYRFINHDGDGDLVYLGRLPHGSPLYVNRLVVEADLVVTTGVVVPHYMAGFAGGRKSILPGVAGRETIQSNHSMLVRPESAPGRLEGNPIHQEMLEAARRAGVDFILNAVTNEDKKIVSVVAGDLEAAWREGVEVCREVYTAPVAEEVDVVIAGVGGHPKDINLYQAQKGLENAAAAVRPGGTIILVAECPEGHGDEVFNQWMLAADSLQDIIDRIAVKFVMGGHKAYAIARVLKEKDCILVSSMDEDLVRDYFFTPAVDLEEALAIVRAKYGPDYSALVMPEASATMAALC